MYNASMQEHGYNESEPLRRLLLCVAKAAKLGQRTLIAWIIQIRRCRIWTRPAYGRDILDFCCISHARQKACAHVDEDVWRRPYHGIEVRVNLDRRAGEDA